MIRRALFAAGIIAVACVACVQSNQVPPAGAPAPGSAKIAAAPPCTFASNLLELPANFVPSTGTEIPPTVGAPSTLPSIQTDLQAAFAVAPFLFQIQLCQLDGVFITDGPNSWGYRNVNTGQSFIALSRTLWTGNPLAPLSLDQYAQNLLVSLTKWPQGDPLTRPSYQTATPNDTRLTVLAVLAHEYGHVLWAKTFNNPPGTDPQYGNFCPLTFPGTEWANPSAPARWQHFGDLSGMPVTVADDPNDDPNDPISPGDPVPQDIRVDRLLNALQLGRFPRAHKLLNRLHAKNRQWPSLFGAFSTNEDFVESFELYTLIHSPTLPLKSLPLQITIGNKTATKDIPATISKRPMLTAMLQCFDNYFNSALYLRQNHIR